MGFSAHRTQNSIRFSLGQGNIDANVERLVTVLPGIVEKLRSLSRAPARV
jgi:cysteine sulfinate desulfinase/cysteine desulfurase-like protein